MVLPAPALRTVTPAHATPRVHRAVAAADGTATVLGAFPTACYLGLPGGAVVAVLTRDAVGLPLGMILPRTSTALDLSTTSTARVARGELTLTGLAGAWGLLLVRPDGRRDVSARPIGRPASHAVADVWAALPSLPAGLSAAATELAEAGLADGGLAGAGLAGAGLAGAGLAGAGLAPSAGVAAINHRGRLTDAVAALLGRGPGLTPAGDDVLCGYLAGCWLFSVPGGAAESVGSAVLRRLDQEATTALSAGLLRHACLGEVLPELANLARAMRAVRAAPARAGVLRSALRAVLGIGHSSGAALAAGLCSAASLCSGTGSGGGTGSGDGDGDGDGALPTMLGIESEGALR